jgi:MFS family permease
MAGSSTVAGGGTRKQGLAFIIGASSVGTLIEWYDFYLYAILAALFAANFFPGDLKGSFLYSLAVFWVGFIVRPFGAVLFGHIGDLVGRKYTFMLTLILMGGATFLVGCLPTFSSIGWLAPILLVVLRIVQGLALGGEYGGAATYIAEHAPDGRRGFYTSWIQTTATFGIVLALLVILAFRLGLGEDDWKSYGWRLPFFLSAVLVVLSAYLRAKLKEAPLFKKLKEQGKSSKNPAGDTFGSGKSWGKMALALFGATAPEGVVWYTGQFYALFYLANVVKLPWTEIYEILIVALVLGSPFFLVFGALSDRIGRRNIMTAGFLLGAVSYYFVFQALVDNKDSPVILTILIFYMMILVTMVYGPIAAFLVEFFPAKIRYSSMSLPYHLGNGVFGGGVPLIGTYIAGAMGSALAGLYYPIVVAGIGVVVSIAGISNTTRNTKIWDEVGGRPLDEELSDPRLP